MNQNLSSYWIFYVVANSGNISKAAKELYISQPAISKSIQKLEESLNCKLFARSSRGVILTEEGKLLYDHVKQAFASLNEGEEELKRSIELGMGHLSIGVSSTLCKHVLLPYLKEFIRRNPHINISITCQSTADTLKLIDENKVDIGLIADSGNMKNLHFHELDTIYDIFVATPEYLDNLKVRGVAEADYLKNCNLMLLDKHNLSRQYVDAYLEEHGITLQETLDLSSMNTLIDFAKVGVGVGCVIRNFVAEELANGSLIEIPLPEEINPRKIGFAYKVNHRYSTSLQTFIDFYESFVPQ